MRAILIVVMLISAVVWLACELKIRSIKSDESLEPWERRLAVRPYAKAANVAVGAIFIAAAAMTAATLAVTAFSKPFYGFLTWLYKILQLA